MDAPAGLLTYREVAQTFKASPMTVRRMADRGELTAIKIGRLVRFDPAEVAAVIERCRASGAA